MQDLMLLEQEANAKAYAATQRYLTEDEWQSEMTMGIFSQISGGIPGTCIHTIYIYIYI